jgi:hypothetical protein
MGLAQIQRVLATLYTDAVWRERFFADPHRGGEALGLSAEETQQLAQLSAQQVAFFASSLQRKRLHEACKLLPLTHRVLGKRFAVLFRRYADTHVPKGPKKHREDAVAFSAFVERVMRGDGIEPPWVVELVCYEALWLNAADPTCRWMVRWFRYPMDKLVQSVVQGDGGQVSLMQPTIALWFRLSRHRRLRHVILSLPRVVSQMLVPSWRQ